MIEISTPTKNSVYNNDNDVDLNNVNLSESEVDFYECIIPGLNQLMKNPSAETVQKVLSFSKTLL